jgi:hypothetical protein
MSLSSQVAITLARRAKRQFRESDSSRILRLTQSACEPHNIAGGFRSAKWHPDVPAAIQRISRQILSRPTVDMTTLTLPEELASLFRCAHSRYPQNVDEMTQEDIHSIIVRIFTNAADHNRAIGCFLRCGKGWSQRSTGKLVNPQSTVRWSHHPFSADCRKETHDRDGLMAGTQTLPSLPESLPHKHAKSPIQTTLHCSGTIMERFRASVSDGSALSDSEFCRDLCESDESHDHVEVLIEGSVT